MGFGRCRYLAQGSGLRRGGQGQLGPGPSEEGQVGGGRLSAVGGTEPVAGRLFTLALACPPERSEGTEGAGAGRGGGPPFIAPFSCSCQCWLSSQSLSRLSITSFPDLRACSGSSGPAASRHLSVLILWPACPPSAGPASPGPSRGSAQASL